MGKNHDTEQFVIIKNSNGKSLKVEEQYNRLYLNLKNIEKITEIKGLKKLRKLSELILDGNKIAEIDGLQGLFELYLFSIRNNPLPCPYDARAYCAEEFEEDYVILGELTGRGY